MYNTLYHISSLHEKLPLWWLHTWWQQSEWTIGKVWESYEAEGQFFQTMNTCFIWPSLFCLLQHSHPLRKYDWSGRGSTRFGTFPDSSETRQFTSFTDDIRSLKYAKFCWCKFWLVTRFFKSSYLFPMGLRAGDCESQSRCMHHEITHFINWAK